MTGIIEAKRNISKYAWTGVLITTFVLLIAAFFYFDRRNEISVFIRAWGLWGVVFAIFLMAAICMTPIPSEGLVVLYLKIYGIYEGIFFAWLGSTLSALAIFIIVRVYGQMLMKRLISPERFNTVDNWIKGKGSLGLLVARLLPIPAFAVNYIAGAMPSMKLWTYLWTAALSMIPYYVGTALVFLGVARETWIWLVLGIVALIIFWGTGYILNKRHVK
ncbi:VTT domain-containing protein [Desulfosporosinus sp. BG]|uniref:TVP38/TMEM64 family protein n=1 Tax=Desulfosporosinus sp. BG TaxID=1633135 RepID=UPI00083A7DDE|nr:VTT domain-containing protein [Desulfosporosinus sp. BG]ODA41493.1 DedA family inner membrane protein YdjZ [Desulfosporosinus sp. BG]